MTTGVAVPQIEGYVACSRCGNPWLLKIIAARTGGLCNDCLLKTGKTTLTLSVGGGRTFEVKRTSQKPHRPKKLTAGRRERIKVRDRARLNALRELAKLHPVEFATILASERAKLGLEPWTIDAALKAQLAEAGMEPMS